MKSIVNQPHWGHYSFHSALQVTQINFDNWRACHIEYLHINTKACESSRFFFGRDKRQPEIRLRLQAIHWFANMNCMYHCVNVEKYMSVKCWLFLSFILRFILLLSHSLLPFTPPFSLLSKFYSLRRVPNVGWHLTLIDSSSSSLNFPFWALCHNSVTRGSRNNPSSFSPVVFSFSRAKFLRRVSWVSSSLLRNFSSSFSLISFREKTELSEMSSWSVNTFRRRLYSFSLSLWWLNSVWRSSNSSGLNFPKKNAKIMNKVQTLLQSIHEGDASLWDISWDSGIAGNIIAWRK